MGYSVFLLAAGFGTRLRPLTLHRPKPLLPLLGFPMVQYAVTWLREHGHERIIVNAHHLWEHVAEWSEKEGLGLQVELPDILGTGGGLRAAREQLESRDARPTPLTLLAVHIHEVRLAPAASAGPSGPSEHAVGG